LAALQQTLPPAGKIPLLVVTHFRHECIYTHCTIQVCAPSAGLPHFVLQP